MISLSLKEKLLSDPFMQKSCLSGKTPVQWHHALTFRGKVVQERFAIVPLTPDEHSRADTPLIRSQLIKIMRERATKEERKKYSWFFKNK